ncbi:MAG: class I SAM-dependent methyltransferase [Sphingosinicella sp.]
MPSSRSIRHCTNAVLGTIETLSLRSGEVFAGLWHYLYRFGDFAGFSMFIFTNWGRRARQRRAAQALERQLQYQRLRAQAQAHRHDQVAAAMREHSQQVRSKLERFKPIAPDARLLEVGSGSEGLIFFFGAERAIGVDPLADQYAAMLPWHRRVQTLTAAGESLPFGDASFDIVLCDNVVDHAEDPRRIVAEISRVLTPGGLLYFTVNFHSRFWHLAAGLHSAVQALGTRFVIGPFADHTVHLTLGQARRLLGGLPFRILFDEQDIAATRAAAKETKSRHAGDWAKRLFFKNARWEIIAVREDRPGRS